VIDLRVRATEPELLDASVPDEETWKSLADLRFVNRWLGGRRILLRGVRPFLKSARRILDVGCGSGDLTGLLFEKAPRALVVGLDRKPLHLTKAPAGVVRIAGDVRSLPFADGSFEIVTANLFLHHFDAEDLPGLLARLYRLATRALVVNDLRRAWVPYLFGRATFPFLFTSKVSINDGLVSIRRSFTKRELLTAFKSAGIPPPTIVHAFPYRLLAVAEKR